METLYNHYTEDLKRFSKMPSNVLRMFYYGGKIPGLVTNVSLAEDSEKIYFSIRDLNIMFNDKANKIFLKPTHKTKGFTYDKLKKKIVLWKNSEIKTLFEQLKAHNILHKISIEWCDKVPLSIVTTGLFEKIISKKITNIHQAIKYHIKYSLRIDVPVKPFYEAIISDSLAIYDIKRVLRISINPVKALFHIIRSIKGSFHTKTDTLIVSIRYGVLNDIINQALQLDRKFDITWSKKRLDALHNKWTKELMTIEAEYMENITVKYKGNITLLEGHSLLTSSREVFYEGKTMHHCIYTNYWSLIRLHKYFGIKIDKPGVRATFGIMYNSKTKSFIYDQLTGIYNRTNEEILREREIVKEWLEKEEIQEFFNNNYISDMSVKTEVRQEVEEVW